MIYILKRFFNKIEQTNNCWNWIGGKQTNGYGMFWTGKELVLSHRFSYELFKDKIPKGYTIDHLCRNRVCVNPEHLEVVTQKINVLRGNSFCSINSKKTHCPKGHELKGDNLDKTHLKRGKRSCKICAQIREKRRWIKIKENQNLHNLSRVIYG